ncbi:hypothetical protein NPIL_609071 [Nephila pilipes]|uniref:Uncharacterized protein n=1 Tax=Nephila pilipes TaxID=299642 RepID=A0A8X6Q5W2_NEPPI|nr:hypothetical protein NPIL_609071 [Nephila pilipes]
MAPYVPLCRTASSANTAACSSWFENMPCCGELPPSALLRAVLVMAPACSGLNAVVCLAYLAQWWPLPALAVDAPPPWTCLLCRSAASGTMPCALNMWYAGVVWSGTCWWRIE